MKGGVKGGHAIAVETQFPRHNFEHPVYARADTTEELWPKGFANVGNTCYANAALQCLLSTALSNALLDPKIVPLFRSYSSNPNLLALGSGSVDDDEDDILNDQHKAQKKERRKAAEAERIRRKENEAMKKQETCRWLTRELTLITQLYTVATSEPIQAPVSYMSWLSGTQEKSNSVVDPGSITRHPDRLSKCLQPYQQEDAHEFLRALLSTLVMDGHNKQLSSLFDGLLESAVTCQMCGRASLTRDRYMDLSLDINQPDIRTLDDALDEYTKTEVLDEDNAVFCAKCDKKGKATKGLRLATAPSVLVCHLKRFAFDKFGRTIRLHKKIQFEESLEIGDYMSSLNKARPPPYDLVGILVHQGQTCASGHYVAFVKRHDEWYKCNDSIVTKVDQATVFDQQAYIMMYEVSEMRERTGCTPRAKIGKQMQSPCIDSPTDEAETLKDETSTVKACASLRSENSRDSAPQTYQRFLNMLHGTDGLTCFLSDMCCDSSGFQESNSRVLKRRTRSRNRGLPLDISTNQDNLGTVVQSRSKKSKPGVRSQTAPRQRTSNDEYPSPRFLGSPRTTRSVFSERKSRQRNSSCDAKRTSASKKIPQGQDRRLRARSIQDLAASGELPPLPKPTRRANSLRMNLPCSLGMNYLHNH